MKSRWISTAVLAVVLPWALKAQPMAVMGSIPPDSVGLPPEPPFLTLLGMANPGKLVTDPSTPPRGMVSEAFYEELRGTAIPANPAGAVEASVRTKFNERGQLVEQIENRFNSESDAVYGYQDGRLASIETTFPNAKKAMPMAWNYWKYDAGGKLTEYRRGRGTAIQNHEVGFRYDDKGRLLAFEYRQGADDKPFSRTEMSYSANGKTIVVTKSFVGTNIVDRSTRTLDERGRVVHVSRGSEGRTKTDEATEISFRYDEKNRLIEQTTDAKTFSDGGAENDLPPGTITTAYDDRQRTKTVSYANPKDGYLELAVRRDENGATIGYSTKTGAQQLSLTLECQFDARDNWASCRQVVESNGQQKATKEFRRTITYR